MLTALMDDGTDTMVFSTEEDKKMINADKIYYKCCGLKNDDTICDDKVFLKRCVAGRYKITSFFSHCKNSNCSESTKIKKNIDNEFLMKWTFLLRVGTLKNKYWITNGEECIFNDNYNIYILKKLPSLDFFLVNNTKKRTVYILDFSMLKNNNIVKNGDEYFIKQIIVNIYSEVIDYKNVDIYIDKLDNLLYKVSLKDIYYDKKNNPYLKLSIVSTSRELITRFGNLFDINNYNFDKIIEDTNEYLINDILTNDITPELKKTFDDNVNVVNNLKKSFVSINQKYEKLMETKYTLDDLNIIFEDYNNVNIPCFKNKLLYYFLKNYINDKQHCINLKKNEIFHDNLNKQNIFMMKNIEESFLTIFKNLPTFKNIIIFIIDITKKIKSITDNNIILFKEGYIECQKIKQDNKSIIKKKIPKSHQNNLFNYSNRVDNVLYKIDNLITTSYIKDLKELHFLKNIENTVELSNQLSEISNNKTYYITKQTTKIILLLNNISSHCNPIHPDLKIDKKEVIHHYKDFKDFFCLSDLIDKQKEPIPFQDIFFESEYQNKCRLEYLGCEWNADIHKYSYNTELDDDIILKIKLMSYKRIYFKSEFKYRDALKKLGCFYDFKKKLSYYPSTFDKYTIKRIKIYETTYK